MNISEKDVVEKLTHIFTSMGIEISKENEAEMVMILASLTLSEVLGQVISELQALQEAADIDGIIAIGSQDEYTTGQRVVIRWHIKCVGELVEKVNKEKSSEG